MKIEIKQKETGAINWSIVQLVIANNGEVVITTGYHEDDTFKGISFDKTIFSHSWTKSSFKKFNGKITISNE